MQIRKKTSLLLLLTMLMTLFPATTPVMAAETTINIQLVKDTSNDGGITTGQMIYFGQYTKSDNSKAPIQWRVMGVEEGKATLLSDQILEYRQYDPSKHNKWAGSDICKYLNSQDLYMSNGFLTTAFTTAEQEYIATYSNVQEHGWSNSDTFTPDQKIVISSVNEVEDGGAFGWNQQGDRVVQNAYRYRDGGTIYYNQFSWLRSPGYADADVAYVDGSGSVSTGGGGVDNSLGVRPALKLNLSSVLFTSDASGDGGKKKTPNSMLSSVANTNNEKKLTLIDKHHISTNPAGQKVDITSDTYKYIEDQATEIEIKYSNATTGVNQYLSAMITDGSGLKYYGAIKSLQNSEDANGIARAIIPADFTEGWTLKIFTEQLNEDYQTDYASEPVEVILQKALDPLPQVAKGDKLYFGQYTKNDDSKAPILWRVMEKDLLRDKQTVTLMSEYILEDRPYDPSQHNKWSESDICKYLNSQDTYTSNGFLTKAFTTVEQGYIATYSNVQEHGYLGADTFTPNQKIVLLCVNEVKHGGVFGWNQNSHRVAQNAEGYRGNPTVDQCWWLRSPGDHDNDAAYVDSFGYVSDYGGGVNDRLGVRPALKLNLEAVSFTSVQSIEVPDAKTGVVNGISVEDLKSQLPTTVSATTSNNSTEDLNISWDLSTISYEPNVTTAQTFSIPGTAELPEGLVKLPDGVTLISTISVTVDAAKYQIEYVLNEGTQAAHAPTRYTYGGGATLPTPTREGYIFKGWYDNVSLTGDAITNIPATDSGNKRYWAKWERITVAPTITADSLSRGTVDKAYNHTLTATGDTPITWSIESGAVPEGLKLDAATGGISGTPTTSGNFAFTAKATNGIGSDTKALSINISPVLTTYTVTFDSNGGNAISAIINITSGEAIILPTPTRSSYRFEGWFNGTTQYTNNTPISKNITLIAKWTELSSSGGGSSSGSSSGGGSNAGENLTPTTTPATPGPASPEAVKKVEETVQKLSSTQKQELAQNIEEYLPYTLPAAQGLTAEQLKVLTKDKFTKEELETLAKKPELLKALGVDINTLSNLAELKPIENPAFKDVPATHWAADTIKKAAELGIAAGKEDGNFAPKQPLQTADTFTFLNRVLLLNNITESTLPRSTVEKYITDKNHWAFRDMASIGAKLSENTLKVISQRGDQPISRELLAQVLYEITKGKLKEVKEVPAFTDIQSSPYQEAINYCVSAGLLNGTGKKTMSPEKELTRAELMAVLIRLDELI